MQAYAAKYDGLFRQRRDGYAPGELDQIWTRLQQALEHKLSMFTLSERVDRCLYFQLQDLPEKMLRVDFLERSVTMVSEVKEPNFRV